MLGLKGVCFAITWKPHSETNFNQINLNKQLYCEQLPYQSNKLLS